MKGNIIVGKLQRFTQMLQVEGPGILPRLIRMGMLYFPYQERAITIPRIKGSFKIRSEVLVEIVECLVVPYTINNNR
jgi:hypothetical protein